MGDSYIKNWKLREGYPEDPESVKEIAEIAKKSGNGWWWFKNYSARIRAESTPSDMYKKKKPQGGRMDLKGKRRGF